MKSRRTKTEHSPKHEQRAASERASQLLATRLRTGLVVAAVALLFASVLMPSEGAIREGAYAPLAAGWCVIGLLWATSLLLPPKGPIPFGWFEIAGLAFVGWHTLSALSWLGEAHDRQTLNALWLMVGYGITALVLRQILQTAQQARALVAVLLGLAVALSACGYEEYFVSKPAIRARYAANPEEFLTANGIPSDPQSSERQRFENRLHSVEPLTTFSLTNSLAGFLTPWLIAALGIGLATLTLPGQRRALIAAAIVAVAIGGCLVLTKSRTAVLACIAGSGLLLLYGRRGGWRVDWRLPAGAIAVATVIGLAAVFAGGLDLEVLSEAPKSILYRLEYWRSTAAMIADYPLLGCGPGNFQESYAAYKLPQASETVADPHNFLLEVWATAGTPGIMLLLATIGGLVADLTRISRLPSAGTPPADTTSLSRWPIYAGAAVGTLLAGPLAAIVGFSPGVPEWLREAVPLPTVWVVGLPVLALVVWAFDDWVLRCDLPLGTILVALIALAINLLAAGAVVFPGVMASALALAPLALTLAGSPAEWVEPHNTFTQIRPSRWPGSLDLKAGWPAGLAAAMFLLTLACLWSEYRPVVTARLNVEEAIAFLNLGQPGQAERSAALAAAADPWWAEPPRLAADIGAQQYIRTGRAGDLANFEQALAEFERRSPRHHSQHFQRGNWLLTIWRKDKQHKHLNSAISAFEKASERFPAQALYHAQLAWTYHLAGNENAAQRSAERAQELDDANPHGDQKLRNSRLLDPQLSDRGMDLRRPETAELTVQMLRTGTSTRIGTGTEKTP